MPSLSNPEYSGMPLFSEAPKTSRQAYGTGDFMVPPPNASQGGDPSHYIPFPGPQRPNIYPNWSSQTRSQPELPSWATAEPPAPEPRWTFGQYPPTPPVVLPFIPPNNTPGAQGQSITPTGGMGPNRYSPFYSSYQLPPASAPAHTSSWTRQQAPDMYMSSSEQPIPAGPFSSQSRSRKSSLKRSNSQHGKQRTSSDIPPQMERSTSSGSAHGYGGYWPGTTLHAHTHMQGSSSAPMYSPEEPYNERNLARRPTDWRPDYAFKPGISSYLPGIAKNSDYVDPVKRIIHPLLQYIANAPPISFDLRLISPSPSAIRFNKLTRSPNDIDFAQLATDPVSHTLRLYHPRLPWYVDIQQSHPNGITVFDVVMQLSRQMTTPILGKHYYNEALDEADRMALAKIFGERTRRKSELVSKGMLQVDFLGDRCILEGFVRGKNGMWEIKTKKMD